MANKVKRKTAVFTLFLLLCSDILWSAPVKIRASIAVTDNIDNVITMAAVVRYKELDLINLKSNIVIRLDDGGMFSRPLISVGKTHIAYLKDTALYISDTEGRRRMVHNNICMECYTWLDNNSLIYSPDTGGLYIYDVLKNKSFPYIEDKFNYRNITIGKYKNIYAEKYFNYIKNGSQYRKDYGIIMINSKTKAEKLLIKSIPIEIGEGLGMYPVIAGISKDLRFLFVFAFPHSASMASDGVAFNIYDTMTNKLTLGYKKILITLAYKDNISSSNADRENIALIAGGGREMKRDKTLFLLNVLSGNLVRLSPKEQAAMTPCSSPDGRTILYAGSIEGAGYEGFFEWMKKGNHNIYSIDIKDRRIKQLTNSGGNFDFSPICINNESFVFFRSNLKGNISMWKYENGKEIRIIENLVFSNDESYPVINYYGHFDISNYADIK